MVALLGECYGHPLAGGSFAASSLPSGFVHYAFAMTLRWRPGVKFSDFDVVSTSGQNVDDISCSGDLCGEATLTLSAQRLYYNLLELALFLSKRENIVNSWYTCNWSQAMPEDRTSGCMIKYLKKRSIILEDSLAVNILATRRHAFHRGGGLWRMKTTQVHKREIFGIHRMCPASTDVRCGDRSSVWWW